MALDDGRQFETTVIKALQALNGSVVPEPVIGGDRLDALVMIHGLFDSPVRIAIDARYVVVPGSSYFRNVTISAYRFAYLMSRGLVDAGLIVGNLPFGNKLDQLVKELGVGSLVARSAEEIVGRLPEAVMSLAKGLERLRAAEEPAGELGTDAIAFSPRKRIFVAIEFSDHNEDVFNHGISSVAEKLGMEAFRVLDFEYNGIIIEKIHSLIKAADCVVSELTDDNPNVYYETGVADAVGKPVILCAKMDTKIRFDVAASNCIFYRNITDLAARLERRLIAMYGR